MLRSVFLKTLRDQRRGLLWWSLGMIALALETQLFYPSIRDTPEFDKFLEEAPKALIEAFVGQIKSFTTPDGYLNGQLFFFVVPLLFLAYAIVFGSGAIPREQDRKTLDLLLSYPISRSRIVIDKFFAMIVGMIVIAVTLFLGLAVGAVIVDMDVNMLYLFEANLSGALLGLVFGAFALMLGCATGARGASAGIAAALGVATYLFNALAPSVERLDDLRFFSPFYFYIENNPVANGLDFVHATVLVALTAVFFVAALVIFERRDLTA